MSRKKKIILILVTSPFLIIGALIILLNYGLRIDDNEDGETDLIISTNLIYLTAKMDFERDGKFDIKIYKEFKSKRHRKVKVLNKNYEGIKIVENYRNGTSCTITEDDRICKKSEGGKSECKYILNGEVIFAASGWSKPKQGKKKSNK